MKKIIAICLILAAVLSFSGCVAAPQSENKSVKIADMDSKYGLTQMCKDLQKKGYLPESGVEMASDVIGAKTGYRFEASVNNDKITVELYEYDPENLNDDAKRIISEVKENGEFNMLDYAKVPAQISKNGKYMVIYNDGKAVGENPDEAHKKQYDEFMKIFNSAK
ncbi:MAG: hypothetical protein ACI4I4_02000 [Acutalibacteraceae bacterium]